MTEFKEGMRVRPNAKYPRIHPGIDTKRGTIVGLTESGNLRVQWDECKRPSTVNPALLVEGD
jgi:hypothetical protein